MRRRRFSPAHLCILALLAATEATAPALADAPAPIVVPPVGSTAHYRVTRTAQEASGLKTAVSDVTLRRKSATTVTLDGVAGDPPSELTVLNVASDGSLQIPNNDTAASHDVVLVDVVGGLNQLIALFAGEDTIPHDGWSATLPLADARGANSVVVPVSVASANGTDFQVQGTGEVTLQPPSGEGNRSRGGRRGGFRGGGGFPGGGGGFPGGGGGGFPGGGQSRGAGGGESGGDPGGGDPGGPDTAAGDPGGGGEAAGAGGRQPPTIAVSIDGQVRHGAVAKLSIQETRSVTIGALPYTNVSGWTIEALH